MHPKKRLILTQKQLSVAIKALKDIRDNGGHWSAAGAALDEIEHIEFVQKGAHHAD